MKLLVLDNHSWFYRIIRVSNTWNHLIACKQMILIRLKMLPIHSQIYACVCVFCVYKQDSALNNTYELICH